MGLEKGRAGVGVGIEKFVNLLLGLRSDWEVNFRKFHRWLCDRVPFIVALRKTVRGLAFPRVIFYS
jgi:hypothetical protein